MMDAHYSALMDLPVSLIITVKLRATYDMIEKHLRSLKAHAENVQCALQNSKLNRQMRLSLPPIKFSGAPTSFRLVPSTVSLSEQCLAI